MKIRHRIEEWVECYQAKHVISMEDCPLLLFKHNKLAAQKAMATLGGSVPFKMWFPSLGVLCKSELVRHLKILATFVCLMN